MDLQKLAGTLLSSDSINGLSSLTGASGSDVTNVLTQALPALLNGANEQAKDKNTAEGFVTALSQHAKGDTNNLAKFMSNVDLADGSKIIGHLLGSNTNSTVDNIAKKTGVSASNTSSILSAIAPLLMSLLGQQTNADANKDSGIESLLGSLLDNVDVGDLLTGLLTDNAGSNNKPAKTGNLLTSLLKGILKK